MTTTPYKTFFAYVLSERDVVAVITSNLTLLQLLRSTLYGPRPDAMVYFLLGVFVVKFKTLLTPTPHANFAREVVQAPFG